MSELLDSMWVEKYRPRKLEEMALKSQLVMLARTTGQVFCLELLLFPALIGSTAASTPSSESTSP